LLAELMVRLLQLARLVMDDDAQTSRD